MQRGRVLSRSLRTVPFWAAVITASLSIHAGVAAPMLGSYNVDPDRISVSGFSAGGFFAMQLGVAYSSVFRGVGIFSGGPYDCARHASAFGCLNNATPDISVSIANMKSWSGGRIDSVRNIAGQRVFILVGAGDMIVGPNVSRQIKRLYVDVGGFVTADKVRYVELEALSHTFPTDTQRAGDNPCDFSVPPYISDCGFDGAGAALQWIYGALKPPSSAALGGVLLAFDQTPFIGLDVGMDSTGWLYLPARCAGRHRCALHVALHGCQQAYTMIGPLFLNNAGYNRWADTNDLIVLYPQAKGSLTNPFACWDWTGFYGVDFDQKSGGQMKAIMAMIERVASGGAPITPSMQGRPKDRQSSAFRPATLLLQLFAGRIAWEEMLELPTTYGAD